MKRFLNWQLVFVFAFAACFLLLEACDKVEKTDRLVKQSCGGCHLSPDPQLLDKKTWERVMPEMAFRMGIKDPRFNLSIPPQDTAMVFGTLPAKPMLTDEEWESINAYFQEMAPDSLRRSERPISLSVSNFDAIPVHVPGSGLPFVSLVKIDASNGEIYAGSLSSVLYHFGTDLRVKDSVFLKSPPSEILLGPDHSITLSELGILEPNEQAKGELNSISLVGHETVILDSLQRPVSFTKVDLNDDHREDYVVCGFGNYTGALLAFENLGMNRFKRHVLKGMPGSRKVAILDANHDGKNDIMVLMTQGNEEIDLLVNQGNFNFSTQPLLRFPPIYGSSFFDLVDFDRDGNPDIVYTNGDNGDFTNILKPYHGVRIFMNDGKNNFSESWFYPMYGASKAIAQDFDLDGDLDIAAISFFPDFELHPEYGFLYFENTGKEMVPHKIDIAARGRWLVMDAADIDKDGDNDLLLGAFDLDNQVPAATVNQWHEKGLSLLLLRNNVHGHD